jgi:hypothetical protein
MPRIRSFVVVVLLLTASRIVHPLPQTPPPVADEHLRDWQVDPGRDGDIKIETLLGRRALWLKNNTHARRQGLTLADGTIELDVAPLDAADFVGITFRRESQINHENIYIRPPRSGEFMALQYAPRTNGSSTWQLYREFTAPVAWPRQQWTHVRVEFHGSRLEVFVGDTKTPALSVARLRHPSTNGEIGFWARVNNRPGEWAAALSNITIRPSAITEPRIAAPAPVSGVVSTWEVAGPLPAATPAVESLPQNLTWTAAAAEESGLVNLNRLFRAQPQQGRFTAFLKTTVVSPEPTRRLAGIGYSDDVTVFVNGEPIYAGTNGWDSRLPAFVGFVDARFERVWLPLRAGANEIVLAVTDDQLFGWGAMMTM